MDTITYKQKSLFEVLSYDSQFQEIQTEMLKDEFYFIQDKCYDFIKPIKLLTDYPIGFVAGDYLQTTRTIKPMITKETYEDIKHLPNYAYFIDLFYLLPEYRDKGVFCNHLKRMCGIYGKYNIILHLPNRFVINSLLENGFARRINDNVVSSQIWLGFTDEETEELIISHIYDLDYCAIVSVGHEVKMSPVLTVDDECFNANENRWRLKKCL